MAVKKEHWLFGTNGIVEFNVDTQEESNCAKCIHQEVCRREMWEFCENYQFGCSDDKGCGTCLHKYTRWDQKQPIPCFTCKHFQAA